MRKYIIPVLTLLLCLSTVSEAGIPDPTRSGSELKGQAVGCQYRFRHDGGLDCLSVCVTLRDIFDVPVPNCTTSVTLNDTGNGSLCSCCPNPLILATDANGVAVFEFKKLGGRGSAEACITALCQGAIAIACQSFDYTSTDMSGDCLATDVIDLGLWAGCLPPAPYCRESDYNCDGTVDVIDLGLFAGGLTVTCADGAACP